MIRAFSQSARRFATESSELSRLADQRQTSGGWPQGSSRSSRRVIQIIVALVAVSLGWAAYATVDEVTRAQGRVIPSSKTQIIQSSETGVVEEIRVRLGQSVKEGDILMRIDATPMQASLGEAEARLRTLKAQIARLRIEDKADPSVQYDCPEELRSTAPEICENEADLMTVRFQNFDQTIDVLESRVEQRTRELSEARLNLERLSNNLQLAREEFDLLEPLAKKQIVAQTDLLRAQREVTELEGRVASTRESIARIEASLGEAKLQVEEARLRFRQDVRAELTKALAELSVIEQTARGAESRVARTDIRSPVDGIVNTLKVTTLGAFVNAGAHVADIVPINDNLLIEGKVRPRDIAFIRPGQHAIVKITSYDFSIYGGLDGTVENVSADSIYDEASQETFYTVLIRSDDASLTLGDKTYPIIPGMMAQVDILTGEKTILDYLLKPLNKARELALRER